MDRNIHLKHLIIAFSIIIGFHLFLITIFLIDAIFYNAHSLSDAFIKPFEFSWDLNLEYPYIIMFLLFYTFALTFSIIFNKVIRKKIITTTFSMIISILLVIAIHYTYESFHNYLCNKLFRDSGYLYPTKEISSNSVSYKEYDWEGNRTQTYHLTTNKLKFLNDSIMVLKFEYYHFPRHDFYFPFKYYFSNSNNWYEEFYKVRQDTVFELIDRDGHHINYVYSVLKYEDGKIKLSNIYESIDSTKNGTILLRHL